MSNPAEPPGENRSVDLDYLDLMRARLEALVPVTAGLGLRRVWAATIDYTPDHLPIIGPALGPDGPVAGVTVASAGGAGMMWGPGVARAAADIALTGTSDVVDTTNLGLDRFDEQRAQQAGRRPGRPAVPRDGARPGARQAHRHLTGTLRLPCPRRTISKRGTPDHDTSPSRHAVPGRRRARR